MTTQMTDCLPTSAPNTERKPLTTTRQLPHSRSTSRGQNRTCCILPTTGCSCRPTNLTSTSPSASACPMAPSSAIPPDDADGGRRILSGLYRRKRGVWRRCWRMLWDMRPALMSAWATQPSLFIRGTAPVSGVQRCLSAEIRWDGWDGVVQKT